VLCCVVREAAFSVLLKYLAKAKPSDTRSIVALRAISAFVTSPKVAVDANLDSFSAVRSGDSPGGGGIRESLNLFYVVLSQITSMKEANELLLQFLKPNVKSFASFAASNAATLQRAGKFPPGLFFLFNIVLPTASMDYRDFLRIRFGKRSNLGIGCCTAHCLEVPLVTVAR
jgi:hypothetical protein